MKFFDLSEPSLTLSRCWTFPPATVLLAPENDSASGDPASRAAFDVPCRNVAVPVPGPVDDSAGDVRNP
jgi:hypothetical protein